MPTEEVNQLDSKTGAFSELNNKQAKFVRLIAAGETKSDAYRQTYNPDGARTLTPRQVSKKADQIASSQSVTAALLELRGELRLKALLSLNDRLNILAGIAQQPSTKKGDRIRAIEVYSRISGDQAPERHELTGKDGQPLQSEVTTRQLTTREKLDRLAKLRDQAKVADAAIA
jgi:hypothetical protein